MSKPTQGTKVRLNTPTNPKLHESIGTVGEVKEWGAVVFTQAAATGQYRAHHTEMVLIPETNGIYEKAKESGYTGDMCTRCGGMRVRKNGTCTVCDDCGETSGCS